MRSFWWKSECEEWDEDYYDYGAFCVGSEMEPRLRIAGMTGWRREEVVFDGTGRAMSVEDDYVAGTDPTNLASKLTATIKRGELPPLQGRG